MKSYTLTLRRRLPDGQLEEVVYNIEHACPDEDGGACSRLDEAHHAMMLVDMEYQSNSGLSLDVSRGPARVWIDEVAQ